MNGIRNRWFVISDVILLILAVYISYVLRLERFLLLPQQWRGLFLYSALLIVFTPVLFRAAGVYKQHWGYASIDELLLLASAVLSSVFVASVIALALVRFVALVPKPTIIPRSVPFILIFLALVATGGPRLSIRIIHRYRRRFHTNPNAIPVAIMGAGDAGATLVRELKRTPDSGFKVVGFLDDELAKYDIRIHGVPVLGDRHDIPQVVNRHRIRQVMIAMPSAPGREIREIVRICDQAGVETKIIPGMYALADGTVSINQLRDVDIEDLLRREPIHTDTRAVEELIRGRRVLVTGGGGSIGSELCRQIWRYRPAELVLLGHGENSIFEIFNELRRSQPSGGKPQADGAPAQELRAVIADVRFAERIRKVFEETRPQIVFHAAAHKHVPLMEANPNEAITNNVLGTRNVLAAAQVVDVEHFVMVSTDKAVNPTNVMGASKRAAELLVHQAAKQSGQPYVAVRFGNVLGSRGSVVNTFKRQIAAGGPVTVTDPKMTRYFMTIPEAVQLVLQASVLGTGGEVFVLDMGDPVKIVDLARDLIELSGLVVGEDIEIVFTGARPGEKLFEELFVEGETYERTEHEKIFIAANASSFVPDDLDEVIARLEKAAEENDREAILGALQEIIPEYRPRPLPEPSETEQSPEETATAPLEAGVPSVAL